MVTTGRSRTSSSSISSGALPFRTGCSGGSYSRGECASSSRGGSRTCSCATPIWGRSCKRRGSRQPSRRERSMSSAIPSAGYGTLIMLALLIAASVWLGTGAPLMGFPSLVYTHGWVVALWIAGYMVVPMTGFGVLGKRMAQLSRRTGAITVPDLFRERFGSSQVRLVALLFILLYMSFMMVAQFKAGGIIMKVAWPGSGVLAMGEDQAAFMLGAGSLESLQSEGVPADVVAKLQALGSEGFRSAAEMTKRLGDLLTAKDLAQYKDRIVKRSQQLDRLYLLGLVIFSLTVVG